MQVHPMPFSQPPPCAPPRSSKDDLKVATGGDVAHTNNNPNTNNRGNPSPRPPVPRKPERLLLSPPRQVEPKTESKPTTEERDAMSTSVQQLSNYFGRMAVTTAPSPAPRPSISQRTAREGPLEQQREVRDGPFVCLGRASSTTAGNRERRHSSPRVGGHDLSRPPLHCETKICRIVDEPTSNHGRSTVGFAQSPIVCFQRFVQVDGRFGTVRVDVAPRTPDFSPTYTDRVLPPLCSTCTRPFIPTTTTYRRMIWTIWSEKG